MKDSYKYTFLFGIIMSALCVLFSLDPSSISEESESAGTTVTYILSAIYVIYAASLPLNKQLCLIALALPNTKALNLFGVSAAICICAVSAVFNLGKKKTGVVIAFSMLYLLYSLQFLYRFSDTSIGVIMPIKTVVNIFFFSMLSNDVVVVSRSREIGYEAAVFLLGGILSAVVASFIKTGFSGRFAVVGNDPNMLAVESAFTLAVFSSFCFKYRTLPLSRYLTYAAALGLVTLFCGSRMGLLLYAIVIACSVLLNPKYLGKSFVVIGILAIGVVAFLVSGIGQTMLDALMTRTSVMEQNDDVSNGRFELWALYIATMTAQPMLWLFGLGNYTYYGIEEMAHNFLIEDIAGYGLIGVMLLYTTYIIIYRTLYKNSMSKGKKQRIVLYQLLPFFVPIIGGLTLHGMTSIMNTTMLFIGVLCMTNQRQVI